MTSPLGRFLTLAVAVGLVGALCAAILLHDRYHVIHVNDIQSLKVDGLTGETWRSMMGSAWEPVPAPEVKATPAQAQRTTADENAYRLLAEQEAKRTAGR